MPPGGRHRYSFYTWQMSYEHYTASKHRMASDQVPPLNPAAVLWSVLWSGQSVTPPTPRIECSLPPSTSRLSSPIAVERLDLDARVQ